MTEPDLLAIAQRCPDPESTACWELAQHPKIERIIRREIQRVAWTDDDPTDLRQAIVLAIAESARRPREFVNEGQVVNYWNAHIRGLADVAIRNLRPAVRGEGGTYQLRETPADIERLIWLAGVAGENEKEALLRTARDVLFDHPNRVSADVFWRRCQGLNWRQICVACKVKDHKTAQRLYWSFVSDAKAVLVELGERVSIMIAGMHIDEQGLALVTVEDGRALNRWSVEYDDISDLGLIQERLEDECRRGVVVFVTNTLAGDVGTVIKLELTRRGLQLEEFDLQALLSGCDPIVLEGVPGSDQERWAYLIAIAKEAENKLKAERI